VKYKKGDVLLLQVTVDYVDENDAKFSYKSNGAGSHIGTWFGDSHVLAVVSRAEEPVTEEEKRLEVGEWVTSKNNPCLGVGQVVEDDHLTIPFLVKFKDGDRLWYKQSDLVRAEAPKPEHKFKIGDLVTSSEHSTLGAGKIIEIDESCVPYKVSYLDGDYHWNSEKALTKVPDPKFKVGDRVIHKNAPHWGVGVIQSVSSNLYSNSDLVKQNEDDESETIREYGNFYLVRYNRKHWESLERMLVKAIE
jgi:hypothetical protein